MKTQISARQFGIGLTLLTVLMLASCGQKPEESASSNTENPTAVSQTKPTAKSATATSTNQTVIPAEAQKLGVKPEGETACPSNAPIKGKITKKRGNIYHVAKSPDYAKVKPEICFKDTATAEKAGFSAPK
ncbi:hypothetical protein NIES37_18940 [Tolypothrix tenuis PCC 7101]|uniref:Uncharacterized protein n=1 Tax=Tolypothrix tenuis PCC 7101 TaxID=231146 RepID=A0A1Z4MWU2_9CYAN|nr:hypothetical protein [Aulosira sp. FACHB-113]BAY97946.1 hypothetical protein NIES37_18940 [Tolypothrix tenuis PCC 7101]BAZ71547.1 hypothetical protein NIES50_00900 [Aulosira laxa NIES-50]